MASKAMTLDDVLSEIDEHSDTIWHALKELQWCAKQIKHYGFDIDDPLDRIDVAVSVLTDIWDAAYTYAHEEEE